MSIRIRSLAVVLVLAVPLTAHGFGFMRRSHGTAVYYYAPPPQLFYAPTYASVAPPCPVYIPTPMLAPAPVFPRAVPVPIFATPTPAPPSKALVMPPAGTPPPIPTPPPATSAPPLASPPPSGGAPAAPSPQPNLPVLPALPQTPSGKPGPGISESRSFFDLYPVVPRATDTPSANRCAAGFWNVSGQDVTLKIDGQPRVLARGQGLNLNVGRQFVWQIEGRDPHTEQVPTGDAGVEIVIRR